MLLQALKRWREIRKQLKAWKIVEAIGQSNCKKGKVMREKHVTDNKPEEIRYEPECKEENKKITRSGLASRQASKKWRERTKQLQTRKNIGAKTYVIEHELLDELLDVLFDQNELLMY